VGDFGILLFCDKLCTDDAVVVVVIAGKEVDRFNLGDFVAAVPMNAPFFFFEINEGDATVSLEADTEMAVSEIILLLFTAVLVAEAAITELLLLFV
jgi:hypothetical protein